MDMLNIRKEVIMKLNKKELENQKTALDNIYQSKK